MEQVKGMPVPATLEDTVGLMLSDDYEERLMGEYWQLRLRIEKIDARCGTLEAAYKEYKQLDEQRKIMQKYIDVIEKRMNRLF